MALRHDTPGPGVQPSSWTVRSTKVSNLFSTSQDSQEADALYSAYDSPQSSYLHYSPSISSSSAPPSPPPVLPPIQHLNATLPVSTGNTPGVMHWRFRESSDARHVKKLRQNHEYPGEYGNYHSTPASPQSLPPLLPHIKMMAQPYPPPRAMPTVLPMSAAPVVVAPANSTRDKNAWKDYAQVLTNENEETQFRCIWRTGHTGEITDYCGYTAKRHLVKRHIETRHLQFKYVSAIRYLARNLMTRRAIYRDHICEYCGKAFPQRVSLQIHVNRQ